MTNLPSEAVEILLAGMPESEVRLCRISLGGMDRIVSIARIARDKPLISWSKAVLPLRLRRQELEKARPSPDGPTISNRVEPEVLELLQLRQGEATFLKVRKLLKDSGFATFDNIPRVHTSINTSRFYTPKIKGLTAKDEVSLNAWLKWLSDDKKVIANLKLPKSRMPVLPRIEQSGLSKKQRNRLTTNVLAEN